MLKKLFLPLYSALCLAYSALVVADELVNNDWEITLGAAPLIVPEYEGADEYRIIPVPLIDIKYLDTYFFSPYRGLGANVLNTSKWKVGPAMTYRLWQDEDDNEALKGLGNITGTLELGGFAYYTLARMRVGADLKQGLNGHKGAIANASLDFIGKINEKTRYSIGPRVAWVSQNYMQTYFGIDADQSAESELAQHSVKAGFKDVGLGGSIYYSFNEQWNMGIFGQYARLVGDAADSPIVKDEGSPNQMTLAFSIGYTF